MRPASIRRFLPLLLLALLPATASPAAAAADPVHVWEKQELTFHAERRYGNPYTDVKVWVELKGPGFQKRVYGFWDGGDTFRVRLVATPNAASEYSSQLPRVRYCDDRLNPPDTVSSTRAVDPVDWECKDSTSLVPVDDVEEFHAKLAQVGADRTKGTMITRAGFQQSAKSFAKSKGIGLARLLPDTQVD